MRNTIRVVCDPYNSRMAYYFKNEIGEWSVLSASSPLSRQYYTNTTLDERGEEIVIKIDEVYNRKNKGLDILFEGTTKNYNYLVEVIKRLLSEKDIDCMLGTTKTAIVGKKAVGKTTLIEGLEKLKGFNYSKSEHDGYQKYTDECNHAEWYELEGIDLGMENVERAFRTIEKLSEEGLSAVIYCISAVTGRIEDREKELIRRIETRFAKVKIMIVLTVCYKEDLQEVVDEIKRKTDQIKIVQILAKSYNTGLKDSKGETIAIESFGLEDVSEFIFEGR